MKGKREGALCPQMGARRGIAPLGSTEILVMDVKKKAHDGAGMLRRMSNVGNDSVG